MAEFSGIKVGEKTYDIWATKNDIANASFVKTVIVPDDAETLDANPNTLYLCNGRTSTIDLTITLKPLIYDGVKDYHQEYHFIITASEISTVTFAYEDDGENVPMTIQWVWNIAPDFINTIEVGIMNGLAVYATY